MGTDGVHTGRETADPGAASRKAQPPQLLGQHLWSSGGQGVLSRGRRDSSVPIVLLQPKGTLAGESGG